MISTEPNRWAADFIDDANIKALLAQGAAATDSEITRILDKAEAFEGLTPVEVAALLGVQKPEYISRIYQIAGKIKDRIYGKRVVMFAPLYVSDYCVNNCRYCGFKCTNKFNRRRLTMDEIRQEVEILERMGHKRLALEAGEDPLNCPFDYILECLRTIYGMKTETGEIRRVNVNIAATTVEQYRALHEAGIGTYILFQETYHRDTYAENHISGPKKDYDYHTTAFHRAMEGGIDDVGGGALFGLYDPRYEVMGLMLHNQALEQAFGVGFHTISMPRICKAEGTTDMDFPYAVDDETFKLITAIVRIAVPFTGIIISTRESPEMRKTLINIGVSQLSGGSAVEVGGYTEREKNGAQFSVADERTTHEIIDWLMDEGLIPSFCTACYRQGRTGDRFMSLAKSGNIRNVCLPNALMTLKEYSMDFGTEAFRQKVNRLIEENMDDIENGFIRARTSQSMAELEAGARDLYL